MGYCAIQSAIFVLDQTKRSISLSFFTAITKAFELAVSVIKSIFLSATELIAPTIIMTETNSFPRLTLHPGSDSHLFIGQIDFFGKEILIIASSATPVITVAGNRDKQNVLMQHWMRAFAAAHFDADGNHQIAVNRHFIIVINFSSPLMSNIGSTPLRPDR